MRCQKTLSLLLVYFFVFTSPSAAQSSAIEILPENISKKPETSSGISETIADKSQVKSKIIQITTDTNWFDLSKLNTTNIESCTNLNQLTTEKNATLVNQTKILNQEFVQVLKQNDFKTLSKLFHPKLNIDFKKIDEMSLIIRQSIGKPSDYSVFKTWLIYNPSQSGDSIGCDNNEYSIHKQLGYSAQISNWIQISGEKDIGRIFISWIVDKEKRLRIGTWHYQRWTHNHADAEVWIAKGDSFLKEKKSLMAILAFDLSLKLLDYRHFLKLKLSEIVKNSLDSSGGMQRFQDAILQLVGKDPVFRTKSLLAPEGLGFQIDFQFKQDISLNDRTKLCIETLKKIISNKDLGLADVDGARCSYYFPKDPIEGESKTGGRYFKKSEIL